MNSSASEPFQTMQEFVAAARLKLPDNAWSYIIGGTETETTLHRNRHALDSLALKPRVLNDVSSINCSSSLFGATVRLPVFLCPIGGLELFNPDGAASVARAASSFGIPMLLSSVSSWSPEELLKTTEGDLSLVFQLYARDDASGVDELVDRCIALNMPAFCVTVDSAIYSRRERDINARFVKPWRPVGNGQAAHYQSALSWKDIERIRKRFSNPIILKGIATAEDALIAVELGVDVIYVSNHGGRQLDHAVASTSALPEIISAVRGRAQVFVDGGYYRGTDIAKAIALGADGVGLGRLMCLALAAAGSSGVVRMLELLEEEFRIALGLLGVTNLDQLNQSYIQQAEPLVFDHALRSAFPLLKNIEY